MKHELLKLLVSLSHGNVGYERHRADIDQLIEMGYAHLLPPLGEWPQLAQITKEGGAYLFDHPDVEHWPDGHLSTPLLWHFRLKPSPIVRGVLLMRDMGYGSTDDDD